MAGPETVSDLAARHGVSRKFVYQQTRKARAALDGAFSSALPDDEVLFELAVTKTWLRQVIVGLALIGRSSYRGIVEFLRDLLGIAISIGCVHDALQAATRQASAINQGQDLSGIRVGLHDELFQGATPVPAGVDAASTYCYLLTAEDRRDADTWACPCSTPPRRGCGPTTPSPMPGRGGPGATRRPATATCSTSSAGARAWPTRCSAWPRALQARISHAGQRSPEHERAAQLHRARQAEAQAHRLAGDVRTLLHWLGLDVLALAGPDLATRRELFDFIVAELAAREPEDPRRLRPVRVALQNQRDDLLAFAGVLDAKLAEIARAHAVPEPLVREGVRIPMMPDSDSD